MRTRRPTTPASTATTRRSSSGARRTPSTGSRSTCETRGVLDDDRIDAIEDEIEETLATLVDRAEDVTADPSELFAYTYAEPTPRLEEQREYLAELRERHGDDELLDYE